MASDRAKLSLRRHKKQTGASQPEVNAALPSSHGASTTESAPPPPVILTAENVGGGSDDAVECDSVHHVVRDVRRESEEFRPVQPQFRAGRAGLGRKRKRTQNGSERYRDAIDDDQLQLGMALSASLQPASSPPHPLPPGKRSRRGKGRVNESAPLPTSVITTSAESQKILAQRASAMLQEVARPHSSVQPPLQRESRLAEQLREAAPPHRDSTLWEMAGYTEKEGGSRFMVSALDLPPTCRSPQLSPVSQPSPSAQSRTSHSPQPSPAVQTHSPRPSPAAHKHISYSPQPSPVAHGHVSHSPQPSPVAHGHISHSPQPSPVAHSHMSHSPQPSPVAHSHMSHSPQPSPVAHSHMSHSPQPSPVAHGHISHSPQPSPAAHSHISHSPQAHSHIPHSPQPSRPPTLPRSVRALLSDLSYLVGSQLCSDVIIAVADGRGIPAHSAILACRCPVLAERLFQSLDKPTHLDFSQFDRATVIAFLRFLYTGTIPHQNGMKSVAMLAMSLGMMEQSLVEEEEKQHPLAGARVRGEGGDSVRGGSRGGGSVRYGDGVRGGGGDGVRSDSVRGGDGVRGDGVRGDGVRGGGGVRGAGPHIEPRPTEPPSNPVPHKATPTSGTMTANSLQKSLRDVVDVSSTPPPSPPSTHSPTPHYFTSPPQAPPPRPPLPRAPSPSDHPSPKSPHTSTASTPQEDRDTASHPREGDLVASPSPSPRPLHERLLSSVPLSVGVASIPAVKSASSSVSTPTESCDISHDLSPAAPEATTTSEVTECGGCGTDMTAGHSLESDDIVTVSATPASLGQRLVLESDTDVTPKPDYQSMATPHLKGECSRFGVRALPKKKMIAKLEEIYNYTHPLTDADGNIVTAEPPEPGVSESRKTEAGRGGGSHHPPPAQPETVEELASKVREVITKDTKLYENMLLYKPLELAYIQSRLKAADLSLSRHNLVEVLDHLCVTFTEPRQHRTT